MRHRIRCQHSCATAVSILGWIQLQRRCFVCLCSLQEAPSIRDLSHHPVVTSDACATRVTPYYYYYYY
jgi:hypothetical protein